MKIELNLINKYQQMANMTKKACEESCEKPYNCCAVEYCELAMEFAQEHYDTIILPTEDYLDGLTHLPMLDLKKGCIVPSHMRPTCTMHLCDINSLGFRRGNPEWTEEYFKLRDEICELELEKYEQQG